MNNPLKPLKTILSAQHTQLPVVFVTAHRYPALPEGPGPGWLVHPALPEANAGWSSVGKGTRRGQK